MRGGGYDRRVRAIVIHDELEGLHCRIMAEISNPVRHSTAQYVIEELSLVKHSPPQLLTHMDLTINSHCKPKIAETRWPIYHD